MWTTGCINIHYQRDRPPDAWLTGIAGWMQDCRQRYGQTSTLVTDQPLLSIRLLRWFNVSASSQAYD
jgi:hypothetical protein